MLSKEKEIFKNIYSKRLSKIEDLFKKNNYNYLKFVVERNGQETDFSKIRSPKAFLDDTEKNKTTIEEVQRSQELFSKYLNNKKQG